MFRSFLIATTIIVGVGTVAAAHPGESRGLGGQVLPVAHGEHEFGSDRDIGRPMLSRERDRSLFESDKSLRNRGVGEQVRELAHAEGHRGLGHQVRSLNYGHTHNLASRSMRESRREARRSAHAARWAANVHHHHHREG